MRQELGLAAHVALTGLATIPYVLFLFTAPLNKIQLSLVAVCHVSTYLIALLSLTLPRRLVPQIIVSVGIQSLQLILLIWCADGLKRDPTIWFLASLMLVDALSLGCATVVLLASETRVREPLVLELALSTDEAFA